MGFKKQAFSTILFFAKFLLFGERDWLDFEAFLLFLKFLQILHGFCSVLGNLSRLRDLQETVVVRAVVLCFVKRYGK